MKKTVLIYIVCIASILIAGFLSGFSTKENISTWYLHLQKPSWNPPNALFAPVWAVLYLFIGIALAQIVLSQHPLKNKSLLIFAIQFILNLFWTQIFFGYHLLGWAVVEIILLLFMIILNSIYFQKIKKIAGWLLIPYLIWISFATCLSIAIFQLNP